MEHRRKSGKTFEQMKPMPSSPYRQIRFEGSTCDRYGIAQAQDTPYNIVSVPNITYISFQGDTHKIDVPTGDSVMEGAVRNGIDGIVAECGGNMLCATCHVYVDEQFLPLLPPIGDEQDGMLDSTASERLPNSRLSCQIQVRPELDGLVVRMPEYQK
jgi:ferredoxin, 2Fe-2S